MSLNSTPSSDRIHIGFFGRRNAGKSSVVNAVTAQQLAVVSSTKGTTTDPVYKTMELLPLGPVVIIDTPGFDDEGELGALRVQKTKQVLNKTDIAVLVVSAETGLTQCDSDLISIFKEKNIAYVIAYNKSDIAAEKKRLSDNEIYISAKTGGGIYELKQLLAGFSPSDADAPRLVGDVINSGDFAVLVVPIDSAAPKGRLILPQQQAVRDILDSGAAAIVTKEDELAETLKNLSKKPSVVITDSQVFDKVNKTVPRDILLTSFSILMARRKGFLETAIKGAAALNTLKNGDTVLISEGCTHHRQCDDIGSVKMPRWVKDYTKKEINFEFSSGGGFCENLSKYALVIHCGGCMLSGREMKWRMNSALDAKVPFTNYGTAIAQMHGILKRSIEVFPHLLPLLK